MTKNHFISRISIAKERHNKTNTFHEKLTYNHISYNYIFTYQSFTKQLKQLNDIIFYRENRRLCSIRHIYLPKNIGNMIFYCSLTNF